MNEIQVSNDMLYDYMEILISKLFKVIPMKEDHIDTLNSYLKSLYKELWGAIPTIQNVKNSTEYLTIVHTVNFLAENETSFDDCKKEILGSIRIIGKLKKNIY